MRSTTWRIALGLGTAAAGLGLLVTGRSLGTVQVKGRTEPVEIFAFP